MIIVASFIEINPLSTEVSPHGKQMLKDNRKQDGRPEYTMPLGAHCQHLHSLLKQWIPQCPESPNLWQTYHRVSSIVPSDYWPMAVNSFSTRLLS